MGVGTLGVAIIGFGLAFKYYYDRTQNAPAVAAAGGLEDE